MKNVEMAMFPLLLVLCLCNLCVFEYPRGRPRLCLTFLNILLSWSLHIYFVVKAKIIVESSTADFPPVIFVPVVCALTFTLLNIYYHKRFKACLKRLDNVNDTLEKLGRPKNHAWLREWTIRIIIGWIISVVLMNAMGTLWFLTIIPQGSVATYILIPSVLDYSVHICVLCEIAFVTLLRYIESLFKHVNQCIENLVEQKKRQVRFVWSACTWSCFTHRHLTDSSKSNQLICVLMHVHLELSSISRELNLIFGLQMVMQIASFHLSVIQFILEFYFISKSIKTHATYQSLIYITGTFTWSAKCIISIVFFTYICEGVCTEANRTEAFLNKLANVTFNAETQENIIQFLSETLRRPLRITGLGLYNYGYKLLHKITERAVKVIIIVIQARAQ